MRPLKSLTFDAVRYLLSRTFEQMPDRRAPERVRYSMHDTLVSAYAMFFFQFPSLLKYQQVMKQQRGRCNLETLFGVRELPSDTQMRDVLDGAPSDPLRRLLAVLFERVRRAGWGERLKTSLPEGDFYTVVLDASDHLVSHTVECPLRSASERPERDALPPQSAVCDAGQSRLARDPAHRRRGDPEWRRAGETRL